MYSMVALVVARMINSLVGEFPPHQYATPEGEPFSP